VRQETAKRVKGENPQQQMNGKPIEHSRGATVVALSEGHCREDACHRLAAKDSKTYRPFRARGHRCCFIGDMNFVRQVPSFQVTSDE